MDFVALLIVFGVVGASLLLGAIDRSRHRIVAGG
jgi:hypothetical protein